MTSEAFISYLRNSGVSIGENCIFWAPNKVSIDLQRPHMLHIGNYCKVTSDVRILTHDYSWSVFCNIPGLGSVGEGGETWIGDNVFVGVGATILMGSHIGSNSIIGAGSVVSGYFPDGVVIAGNPARIICTVEELYKKRKSKELDSAKLFVKQYRERNGKSPTIYDMTNSFMGLYLPRTEDVFDHYPSLFRLSGVDNTIFMNNYLNNMPLYDSFEDFLKDCD